MQILPKYMFFGGVGGAALVAVVLAASGTATANTDVFLEQETISASMSAGVRGYQQVLCEDISYNIASIELALSGGQAFGGEELVAVVGKLTGTGGWEKAKKREVARSAPVSFSSASVSRTAFMFDTPVDIGTLCASPDDIAYFYLDNIDPATTILVHGSADPNAYRSALYGCVLENGLPCLGDVRDLTFALGTTVNSAPVIDALGALKVAEGETLTFTLSATDPDGDTVTWGSSDLPDTATLDSVTGEFTFSPTSEQVGAYEVVFTATDDGGPIQQSSAVQVTITVLDVDTPIDLNGTLEETVVAHGLEKNIENSYLAHVRNLETFIERGQTTAASNQVDMFMTKLAQDLEKGNITQADYDALNLVAQNVKNSLE